MGVGVILSLDFFLQDFTNNLHGCCFKLEV